jgi:alkylation response protein AidB-like acyl-CoA dehydrogenase
MPWAPLAQVFLLVDGGRIYSATPRTEVASVATLGGEPWGRCRLQRDLDLGDAATPLAVFNIAHAAYCAAAATTLVAAAAEHARTRRQFGRAIGEFQAVAHPLAECSMRLAAAATLARAAACRLDEADADAARFAAAARRSADSAATMAIDVCHQTFGAIGITVEGPAFHITRRLRQLVSAPPRPNTDRLLLAGVSVEAGGVHE